MFDNWLSRCAIWWWKALGNKRRQTKHNYQDCMVYLNLIVGHYVVCFIATVYKLRSY